VNNAQGLLGRGGFACFLALTTLLKHYRPS
jgi:hypothetical protein